MQRPGPAIAPMADVLAGFIPAPETNGSGVGRAADVEVSKTDIVE